MEKFKKVFAITLTAVLLVSMALFSGCGKTLTDNTAIKDTGKYIVKNSISSYRIVVPQDATNNELFAANELKDFIRQASNCTLMIQDDSQVALSGESKFLSIGRTSLLDTTDIDLGNLGMAGFIIKTINNSVFMCGQSSGEDFGTIYAVYEFLKVSINFATYASDEIVFDMSDDVSLFDINIRDIPYFSQRSLGYLSLLGDSAYATRLRLNNTNDGQWGIRGHGNVSQIMLKSLYGEHTDWYNESGNQLCYSNEEMIAAFIERMIEIIQLYPNATYFMLGQEDNSSVCNCDACKASRSVNGGESGLQITFANKVAKEVDKWLEINQPGREIKYVIYGYWTTVQPPVKVQNGKYVPVNDDVIPYKNVWVQWADTGNDASVAIEDSVNAAVYGNLKGWGAVTDILMVYSYCVNFKDYLVHYNNFSSAARNYQIYHENNVNALYDQGPTDTNTACFMELRIYVQSKLMWNPYQNYDDLAYEFIDNYFKDAAVDMREFYDLLRNWYGVLVSEHNLSQPFYDYEVQKAKYWPQLIIENFENILAKAELSIAPLKQTNKRLYTTLHNRIKKEGITFSYLKLRLYKGYLDKATIDAMVDELEYYASLFALTRNAEGSSMFDYLTSLR